MKIIENLIFRRTDLQNEELMVFCGVIKTTTKMMRDAVQIETLNRKSEGKKRFCRPSHNVDWINLSQNRDKF